VGQRVTSVTAEAAGSSPVVPAIHSKPVRRILLKPSGARKGHVSRLFCAPLRWSTVSYPATGACHILGGRKDQRYHRSLRCMLRGSHCLRVNVQRGAKRRMSQQLLHYLELSPYASQQGRVGVPERIPSKSLLNSDSLRRGTYVLAQDRLAPVSSSALTASAANASGSLQTTLSKLPRTTRSCYPHTSASGQFR
jgi:hypothetical protein